MKFKKWISVTVLFSGGLISTCCAATSPYIYNQTESILRLTGDDNYSFTYIRAYPKDGETVLYGKVAHRCGRADESSANKEQVDLTVTGPDGRFQQTEVLPLRAVSPKQHGWVGASFRTRLKPIPAAGSMILLTLRHHE